MGLAVRATTIAYTSIGTASVANGVLMSFLPLYIFGFTGSDFLAAAVSALPSIGAMATAPFWGALKDRSGSAKPLMILGIVPFAGLSFSLLFVRDTLEIFVGWAVASILIGSTNPVFAAFVTEGEPKRGAAIGLLSASIASGGAVGALIGGVAYQWYDLRIAFALGGASAALAAAMVFFLLRERRGGRDLEGQKTTVATLRVLQNRDILKPCVSCFSFMVGITAFSALASIYVVAVLGGSPILWGVSSMLAYLSGALVIAPVGRLSDRIGRKRIIAAGLVLQLALYLSFVLYRDPLFVAALLVAPLTYVVCNTITTLVTDFSSEGERGKAVGVQYAFLNGGGVVGPLLGGGLAEAAGIGAVLIFAVACVLFSLVWLQRTVSDAKSTRISVGGPRG